MKRILPLLPLVIVLGPSCERHEFEGPNGTKQLHEHHGSAHHEGEAGEDHGTEGGH